ncbi:MAG: gamma-glutamyltransferase [Alphaproteobacteria bacterium]|nr:gamma-glutamyltransferase [Alphaproteobacteria bacterium]
MKSRLNTVRSIVVSSRGASSDQGSIRNDNRQLGRYWGRAGARILTMGAALLGVAACGSGAPKTTQGTIGYVEGFLGGVAADEPRAALIGRDILSSGGSAADAAAAMYFALAVTMPARAGIGGGGMCVVYDPKNPTAEVLDFTAPSPAAISQAADRPSAIPTNPRGIFALQARYGRLLWKQVVAPGERLARFGHPVSRALSRDLAEVGPALLADPSARAVFGQNGGATIAREGTKIDQVDLAATMSLLRARGVGPFYTGLFARQLVDAVNSAGGSLSIEELRNYTPQWRPTVRVDVGNDVAHFAPPPAAASMVAASMIAMLNKDGGFDGDGEGLRAHLVAETGLRAFAARETWLTAGGQGVGDFAAAVSKENVETVMRGMTRERKADPQSFRPMAQNRHEPGASTAFAAVDPDGVAVSCAVSMNAKFGTGRIAPGTGILMAAAPGIGGRGPIDLAPMLIINENSHEFRMAAGASGGVAAPSALSAVVMRLLELEEPADVAVAAPRAHHGGDPDVTYHEPELDGSAQQYLSAAGHRLAATPVLGQVNVLYCPKGLPADPASCEMTSDPRGAGLAAGSMK